MVCPESPATTRIRSWFSFRLTLLDLAASGVYAADPHGQHLPPEELRPDDVTAVFRA